MGTRLNFKDIDVIIKSTYYTHEDDTVNDFLIPVLKKSKIYKRETYSFSSAFFSLIGKALIDIVVNDCKMFYIVGIEIEAKDLDAIEEGLEDKNGVIEEQIINEFGKVENLIMNLSNKHDKERYFHRLRILSYLVSKEILNIKVGFVSKKGVIVNPTMNKFHPKIMIFEDEINNIIVATGSINESLLAHTGNAEFFDVYKSWESSTLHYLDRHVEMFDKYWSNNSDNIKTISVNKLIQNKVLLKYKAYRNKEEIIKLNDLIDSPPHFRSLPPLRYFQEKVVNNWLERGNKGIFSLATGAGKTRAAIEVIIRLFEKNERKIVVIMCPYRALCEQWFNVLKNLTDFNPSLVYEGQQNWYSPVANKLLSFKMKNLNNLVFVTTNATFSGTIFQKEFKKYWKDVFLIVDECHHVANTNYEGLLSQEIPYRLGLSATPENEYDNSGNKFLFNFFHEITPDKYSLSEAIHEKYLNEYNYYPVITELDEDEKEEFEKLLLDILEAKKNNDNKQLFKLYEVRDKQIDRAKTKLPNLLKLLDKIHDISHTIIYCSGNDQLKKVSQILKDKGIKFGKITAEESFSDRMNTLEEFSKGYIKVLLSIRVLDEGIDIPAIKTAIILKSSTRTRQSIQRRGRCLRIPRDIDGTPIEKDVSIYDFLVIPHYDFRENLRSQNLELIELEMKRINEFIKLAKNKDYAIKVIRDRINILK